ncbi:MAG: prolipoprotein diacylglyceryl transferase [Verrucomicrobiota bacterium]
MPLAEIVHHFDPFVFRFSETVGLRWYGLAYLGGFLLGFAILKRLCERGFCQLQPKKVADFITYAAIFGVLLGGRLGYMLFYNLDGLRADPLSFIKVWDGGMASHGGILGLVFFTLYYSRKHGLSWRNLGDNLVCVAPLGILFGRLANFINGELYGRIAQGVPWAMKFPMALERRPPASGVEPVLVEVAEFNDEPLRAYVESGSQIHSGIHALVAAGQKDPRVLDRLGDYLAPRHPSQLYEGLLEGALLFGVLMLVRFRFPRLRYGILTGLFFVLYALFRIVVENYREPDLGIALWWGLSRGQFLSLFLLLIGVVFLVTASPAEKKRPA